MYEVYYNIPKRIVERFSTLDDVLLLVKKLIEASFYFDVYNSKGEKILTSRCS